MSIVAPQVGKIEEGKFACEMVRTRVFIDGKMKELREKQLKRRADAMWKKKAPNRCGPLK